MNLIASLTRTELGRGLWTFRKEFLWVGLFSLVANLLMLTPTLYMLQVYDRVMLSQSEVTLIAVTLVMVLFTTVMAIAELVRIKGIGRWSAEIYLLFAEGRPDIWPAGDLAVQAGLHKLLGLDARPSEKETRELAEAWRPHRGAAAIFTWHVYNNPAL